MGGNWQNYGLLIIVSAGVDYWIATLLASRNDEIWFFFILLLLVPIFFLLKFSLIRLILWFFIQRIQTRGQIHDYLLTNDFPKPDEFELSSLNGPEEYLERLMQEEGVTDKKKHDVAKTLGMVHTLNQSQQVIAKLTWSIDFLKAMKNFASFR